MANKVVDATKLDSDLTSIANAIRSKGGTTSALSFPQEFVSAIDAIETGGGSNYPSIEVFSGWSRELEKALGKSVHIISLPKIGIMSDATVTVEVT